MVGFKVVVRCNIGKILNSKAEEQRDTNTSQDLVTYLAVSIELASSL